MELVKAREQGTTGLFTKERPARVSVPAQARTMMKLYGSMITSNNTQLLVLWSTKIKLQTRV